MFACHVLTKSSDREIVVLPPPEGGQLVPLAISQGSSRKHVGTAFLRKSQARQLAFALLTAAEMLSEIRTRDNPGCDAPPEVAEGDVLERREVMVFIVRTEYTEITLGPICGEIQSVSLTISEQLPRRRGTAFLGESQARQLTFALLTAAEMLSEIRSGEHRGCDATPDVAGGDGSAGEVPAAQAAADANVTTRPDNPDE